MVRTFSKINSDVEVHLNITIIIYSAMIFFSIIKTINPHVLTSDQNIDL